MEGSTDPRKFDGRFRCHQKGSRKVQWTHGKLMEVPRGCVDAKKLTEYPRPHGKLTEGTVNAQKVDESSRKVMRQRGM